MTPVEQHRPLKSSNPILAWPQFERRAGQKTMAKDPRAGIAVGQGRSTTGQGRDQTHDNDMDKDGGPLPLTVGDLLTMDDVLPRWLAGLGVTALFVSLSWTLLPHVPVGTAVAYALAAWHRTARGGTGGGPVPPQAAVTHPGPDVRRPAGHMSRRALDHGVQPPLPGPPRADGPGDAGDLRFYILLAHRLHWMRVHRRRYGLTGAVVLALCLLALADTALFPLMGADGLGLRSAGLGVLMGLVGVALTVTFLPLHLRKVEAALTHGAPRDQRWSAAFGLTLSLTWLYVETARLVTYYPVEYY